MTDKKRYCHYCGRQIGVTPQYQYFRRHVMELGGDGTVCAGSGTWPIALPKGWRLVIGRIADILYNAHGVQVAKIVIDEEWGWRITFANGKSCTDSMRNLAHWDAANLYTEELAAIAKREN